MNEETLLQIQEEELFDLTELAYQGRFRGMYPSAGGCDEVNLLLVCSTSLMFSSL